jgi:hypothetical protein
MRWLALAIVVILGCSSSSSPTPGPSPGPRPSPSPGPSPKQNPRTDPGRWACATDKDCINSCAAGAVNAAWYATAHVEECEDGCDNQVTAAPRCIAGSCVAFQEDPHDPDPAKAIRNDYCTHKTD